MSAKAGYVVRQIVVLSPQHRALWVLAMGHGFVLAATAWFVVPQMLMAMARPVADPWFPAALQSPTVHALAFLGPIAFGIYVAFRPVPGSLRLWAWWCLIGGAVGLVHQMTIGTAECLLMFWTGAWALWLGYTHRGVAWGPWLATLLLGLMFAYPAIGKYTPAYWSGEAYWDLHWQHGSGLPGLLVMVLGEEVMRPWTRVYGPASILVESATGLVWLLPRRAALGLVLAAAMGVLVGGGLGFMGAMGLVTSTVLSAAALLESERFERLLRPTDSRSAAEADTPASP